MSPILEKAAVAFQPQEQRAMIRTSLVFIVMLDLSLILLWPTR